MSNHSMESSIGLNPVTDAEISMVSSRDFDGLYPYLGLLPSKYGASYDAQGITVNDQIIAYGVAGTYTADERRVGEVGMTHVSPSARGLGLGTLMGLSLRQRLMEDGPDLLETKIGDSTGKVEHIVKMLGYTFRGMSDGAGRHPIWAKDFQSDDERQVFSDLLEQELHKRWEFLQTRMGDLAMIASEVDKDNPTKVSIEQTVATRLATKGIQSPDNSVTYFGYVGAPVRIARSILNENRGYSIMLDLKGVTLEQVLGSVSESDGVKVSFLEAHHRTSTSTVRIDTRFTYDPQLLESQVQQLASIAARFFPAS